MREVTEAHAYYDEHAFTFASQATDKNKNQFEYICNLPSIIDLTDDISGRTLDFGCGAGNFTNALVKEDRSVEGCDASPNLLDYTRTHYPDIPFFQYDGQTERNNEQYKLIVAKLVFHYIQPLELVLQNITEQLEPSGSLCFSVPHPDKTRAFVDDVDEAIYTDEVGTFGLKLNMIHRSKRRYEELLAATGLNVEKKVTVSVDGRPKRLNVLATKQRH